MKVRNIMHLGVVSVTPDASLAEIARKMRDQNVGAVTVLDSEEVVGIITDRDITCRALTANMDLSHLRARDIMTRNVVCCTTDEDARAAVQIMGMRKIRRMPVLDGHKHQVGILSLGDISHKMGADLSAEMLRAVSAHHG